MVDIVNQIQSLRTEIDTLKSKIIELKASAKKEEEILRSLVIEVKDLGFDPKTLKEDIIKMEEDINTQLQQKSQEVLEVKRILTEIDSNVKSL